MHVDKSQKHNYLINHDHNQRRNLTKTLILTTMTLYKMIRRQ